MQLLSNFIHDNRLSIAYKMKIQTIVHLVHSQLLLFDAEANPASTYVFMQKSYRNGVD